MTALRVLLLDPVGMRAYRRMGRQTRLEEVFATPEDPAFHACLADDATLLLLADLPEETFQIEALPHVMGRARRALLARKQTRHAQGNQLSAVLPLGRDSAGRRDDRYLFMALASPRHLDPWLHPILASGAALRGVYSAAQLAARFVPRRDGGVLFVSMGRAGLRQTLVVDGKPRFSRLTAVPASIPEGAAACATEASKLRRYLHGQRLIPIDEVLDVLILAATEHVPIMRELCRDDEELRFDYLGLAGEAANRGLVGAADGDVADLLLAHELATQAPRCQFAAPSYRRAWRFALVARGIRFGGMAALAAALSFTALSVPGMLDDRVAADALQGQNDTLERALDEVRPRQGLALPAAELSTVANMREALRRASPEPHALLTRIGAALASLDDTEVTRLEWRVVPQADPSRPSLVVDVAGTVASRAKPDHGREQVERFAERLRATPGTEVRVHRLPFALPSDRTLRSGEPIDDNAFNLQAVQKP